MRSCYAHSRPARTCLQITVNINNSVVVVLGWYATGLSNLVLTCCYAHSSARRNHAFGAQQVLAVYNYAFEHAVLELRDPNGHF